ncbi:MAG: radical SAM protein [Candidatus Woesearchaeota archaeon]
MEKTKFYSWKNNELASGCKQCVLGRKLVVFVTGVCSRNCFYCPLSEQKKNHDVIFANERELLNEDDTIALVEESKACRSLGAGITGGDPLARIERTCKYIKLLKNEFGKKFHIHLYAIMETLTQKNLKMLDDAGLDELRLHPDFMTDKNWKNIEMLYDKDARKYSFDIGVEIPCIPGYDIQTRNMIDYFAGRIDFLNLNELEISDTNSCELVDRKFVTKDAVSYGVRGSEELAFKMLRYCKEKYPKLNVHYCTCKLKDGVQLRERLKLRAENTKKIFDIVIEDGTLIRGVIYLHGLKPSFGYKTIIKNILPSEHERFLKELDVTRKNLINEFGIPSDMLMIDEQKLRIITNIGVVKKLAKHLHSKGLVPAIVEQYPTWDQMEVDVEFL